MKIHSRSFYTLYTIEMRREVRTSSNFYLEHGDGERSLNYSAGRCTPVAGAAFRRQVTSGALAQGMLTLLLF